MHDDTEYTPHQRALMSMLPRESEPNPVSEERIVSALRSEEFFRERRAGLHWLQIAAAIALLLVGAAAGARWSGRRSLEAMLARRDLTVSDRILLLQRAGSAYVRAAHGYADATAKTDSTAVEVASQVLLGAAHAVARNHLDRGVSAQLIPLLESSSRGVTASKPIIWY